MDKEKQKQAITEIMNEDAKDGLYKQQTAVQWLYHKLQSECLIDMADDIFEQAKKMEREQIEAAYVAKSTSNSNFRKIFEKQAKDYYTQTYRQ